MRTLTAGTAALLLAASLAVTMSSCSADGNNPTVAPQAKIPAGLAVEGYAIASPDATTAAVEALDRSGSAIDTVGVSGVAITTGGAGVAAPALSCTLTSAAIFFFFGGMCFFLSYSVVLRGHDETGAGLCHLW